MPETQPGTLAAALVQLQARLPHIGKSETAKVPTKTGGEYSYRYASLSVIHAAIFPLLRELGLLWVCKPDLREDGQFVLAYKLEHIESGESETGEYPLGTGAPQAIGSAITYGRRYLICCLLGIVPDEDDDGAQGTDWKPPAHPHSRKADRHRADRSGPLPDDDWTGSAPDETPGSITDGRKKELGYWFTKAGITSSKDRLAYAMSKLDRPELTSSDDLSEADGIKLAGHLKEEGR